MQSIRFLGSGFLVLTFGIVSSEYGALGGGPTTRQLMAAEAKRKETIIGLNKKLKENPVLIYRARPTIKNSGHPGIECVRKIYLREYNRVASNETQRFNRYQAIKRVREAWDGIAGPKPPLPGISRQEELNAKIDLARQRVHQKQNAGAIVQVKPKSLQRQENVHQFLRRFNEAAYVENK